MRVIALDALAFVTPMAAHAADPLPVDKAADLVLKQCVEHARRASLIKGQNGDQLDRQGRLC